MKINTPFILVTLFLGGVSLFFGSQIMAAGISISPVTFELTANPGDVLTNKIKVFNSSANTIAIKMETEDFKAVGEVGEVVVAPEDEITYSLKRWVKTNPTEFILEPGQQKFVTFTISVPENAEPGGKYGSVLASTVGVAGSDITGAAIAQKLGSLVLLTVSGEVTEDLTVKDFTVPGFLEYGPVPFTIRLENHGTVHVRPRGFITVFDWRGNKVADIEFPQQNVIPGAVRKIQTYWDKNWLFGRYSATIVGSYGASNIPLKSPVVFFWAFPWKVMLGVFLVLFLVTTYFVKTRKRWRMALRILLRGERY